MGWTCPTCGGAGAVDPLTRCPDCLGSGTIGPLDAAGLLVADCGALIAAGGAIALGALFVFAARVGLCLSSAMYTIADGLSWLVRQLEREDDG